MVANHLHSPPHPAKQSRSIVRRLYNSSIPEIAVILLAGIVRFWRLGYHSFWFDEAVSLSWAGSDPGYTWRVTFALIQDKHPPVYYIALHYWQQLLEFVGLAHSDVALRAFGALLGVLTVWGTMLLARRLSGRPTGLAAALVRSTRSGARLVQPGITHVPAGNNSHSLDRILLGARLELLILERSHRLVGGIRHLH